MSGSEDESRVNAELRDALDSIRAVHEDSSPRGSEGANEADVTDENPDESPDEGATKEIDDD